MTIKYPDRARLIWVESFLSFAAYGNAEQAEKEAGITATGIQRHVAKLERWLRRMLITESNPAELSEYGYDFVDTALVIHELLDKGLCRSDISRMMVLQNGFVLRDGYRVENKHACDAGQLLISCRAVANPLTNYEIASAQANRSHRAIKADLQRGRGNLHLIARSAPSQERLVAAEICRRRIRLHENALSLLESHFEIRRLSVADLEID